VEEISKLRRYARALARDRSHADDLVQDRLVRALENQHIFRPGTNLWAWLFTTLHNMCVNQIRRGAREGTAVDIAEAAAAAAAPALVRPVLQGERLTFRDLHRPLGRLPEEQRQAVLFVPLEGLPYEQAAAVLGVPIGTIRSRLSHGRSALRPHRASLLPSRNMLKRRGDDPGGAAGAHSTEFPAALRLAVATALVGIFIAGCAAAPPPLIQSDPWDRIAPHVVPSPDFAALNVVERADGESRR
jgi:RNA polymerase sigma-70 factor (ECF subfamily)